MSVPPVGGCQRACRRNPAAAHLLWSRMSCAESKSRKSGKAMGALLLGLSLEVPPPLGTAIAAAAEMLEKWPASGLYPE